MGKRGVRHLIEEGGGILAEKERPATLRKGCGPVTTLDCRQDASSTLGLCEAAPQAVAWQAVGPETK